MKSNIIVYLNKKIFNLDKIKNLIDECKISLDYLYINSNYYIIVFSNYKSEYKKIMIG